MISVAVKVNSAIVDRINKKMAQIRENVSRGKPHTVTVGLHRREGAEPKLDYHGDDQEITLVATMAVHEFGSDTTPRRSWLRGWFDHNYSEIRKQFIHSAKKSIGATASKMNFSKGKFNSEPLDAFGIRMAKWIATRYVRQQEAGFVPLSEKTIKEKDEANLDMPSTPLVATHQFISSVYAKLDGKYIGGNK